MQERRTPSSAAELAGITRRMTTRWIVLGVVLLLAPFVSASLVSRTFGAGHGVATAILLGWGLLAVIGLAVVMVSNRADRARLRELAATIRARRLDVCRRCGYDLSGARTDGTCPECGLGYRKFITGVGAREARGESPSREGTNRTHG